MAVRNGAQGCINGKIGNRVTYLLNGREVTRLLGSNVKQPTVKQLANRQRMKVVIAFLKVVKEFIEVGFALEAAAGGMYPQNSAVSYNKKYALKGGYPEIEIDYPRVLLSKGDLQGLPDASVSLLNTTEGVSLLFNWTLRPEDQDWPRCDDQVLFMAYFPEVDSNDHTAVLPAEMCFKPVGARRKNGQGVLQLDAWLTGRPMQVYITAIADDRKSVANSQYLHLFTG